MKLSSHRAQNLHSKCACCSKCNGLIHRFSVPFCHVATAKTFFTQSLLQNGHIPNETFDEKNIDFEGIIHFQRIANATKLLFCWNDCLENTTSCTLFQNASNSTLTSFISCNLPGLIPDIAIFHSKIVFAFCLPIFELKLHFCHL